MTRAVSLVGWTRSPISSFESHHLRQVALGHGADDTSRLAGRVDKIPDKLVYRVDGIGPGAADVAERRPLRDLALLADDPAQAVQLTSHPLIQFDDFVKRIGHLACDAGPLPGQPYREVTLLQRRQCAQQGRGIDDAMFGFMQDGCHSYFSGRRLGSDET
jgi:hypothetical protein